MPAETTVAVAIRVRVMRGGGAALDHGVARLAPLWLLVLVLALVLKVLPPILVPLALVALGVLLVPLRLVVLLLAVTAVAILPPRLAQRIWLIVLPRPLFASEPVVRLGAVRRFNFRDLVCWPLPPW